MSDDNVQNNTILFAFRFLVRGYRKSLRFKDQYDIDNGDKCKTLVPRFERSMNYMLSKRDRWVVTAVFSRCKFMDYLFRACVRVCVRVRIYNACMIIILYYTIIHAGAVCAFVYAPTCICTCMRADVRTHVRMRLHRCEGAHVCACWLAYVRACARVRIYACMIIILFYYICGCSVCARVWVRVCGRVCTYVHANIYAHVSAGPCAYACAYVSARM